MYTYAATVVRVIDGDTAILDVDLGFRTWRRGGSFRVAAINARELHAEGGPEARDHLAALLPVGTVVTLTSVRPDKYGERYDALIALPDGSDLGPSSSERRGQRRGPGAALPRSHRGRDRRLDAVHKRPMALPPIWGRAVSCVLIRGAALVLAPGRRRACALSRTPRSKPWGALGRLPATGDYRTCTAVLVEPASV